MKRAAEIAEIVAFLHHFDITGVLTLIPTKAWTPAYNADGKHREARLRNSHGDSFASLGWIGAAPR